MAHGAAKNSAAGTETQPKAASVPQNGTSRQYVWMLILWVIPRGTVLEDRAARHSKPREGGGCSE